VWDLQAHDDRLFIGQGNSANEGVEMNAGPIPITSLDPATDRFRQEHVASDEQVDRFRVLEDGSLWTGTHDPRGTGVLPGFYRRDAGAWIRRGTMTTAKIHHVYDVHLRNGAIYAAAGNGRVYRSRDDGATWTDVLDPAEQMWPRVYNLMEVGGVVYAHAQAACYDPAKNRVLKLDTASGLFKLVTGQSRTRMFPGYPTACDIVPRMVRPTNVAGGLLYIGADSVNDHQWAPRFAYFAATPASAARRLTLPSGHVPYDIHYDGTTASVLTAKPRTGGGFDVSVVQSRDLTTWKTLVTVEQPTFARSFERLGGAWYLGLGTDVATLSPASGRIVRVELPG
jgi:hypothetical protein